MIELQQGLRYLRRDGLVTGPLNDLGSPIYSFEDPVHKQIYCKDGRILVNMHIPFPEDLVSVYLDLAIATGKGIAETIPDPLWA